MTDELMLKLITLAEKYETEDFIIGDPSYFMHQVEGAENQEVMAFIASVLSYGSRKQFMPKIQSILDESDGDIYRWTKSGCFSSFFVKDDKTCFYRLYTKGQMYDFMAAYQKILVGYGTLGEYLEYKKAGDGFAAVKSICEYFSGEGISVIIPKDVQSACKRVCMFLRWMVRSGSPVDLGLWSQFIDRRSLIMPMDTHVLHQAVNLGLLATKTASMSAARALTSSLAEVFPDDPLRGDFALFGLGVNSKSGSR